MAMDNRSRMQRVLALLPVLLPQAMLGSIMLMQRQWVAALVSFTGIVSYIWMNLSQHVTHERFGESSGHGQRNGCAITDSSIIGNNARITAETDVLDAPHPPCCNLMDIMWSQNDSHQSSLAMTHPKSRETKLLWQTIVHSWLKDDGRDTCAHTTRVPLGTIGENQLFHVDLVSQGPHALMAGTTGSGKSAMLQSWCLALAMRSPPDQLNLVLLDFKGGAGLDVLQGLPHTVGCVSDLQLQHAQRALLGLERELRNRELLVSQYGVADVMDIDVPPPRLIIVIDEANALCQQIPEAMKRLSRVASLGRSLGMNLIMCTQNPASQLSTEIKANMALRICLRVQDPSQALEMIGRPTAAHISPTTPGMGLFNDGASITLFRSAYTKDCNHLITNVRYAASFLNHATQKALFTSPLPPMCNTQKQAEAAGNDADTRTSESQNSEEHSTNARSASSKPYTAVIGLEDDGVRYRICSLRLSGNVAIIGSPGRGKTTILRNIQHALAQKPTVNCTFITADCATLPSVTPGSKQVWLVDDADELCNPSTMLPLNEEFNQAIRNPDLYVIFAVDSPNHFRLHEYCPTRIIFPSGEMSLDILSGISPTTVKSFAPDDLTRVGRAVVIAPGIEHTIQCSTAYKY
ncbi:cell division protein, FtsK/SpoIIIE [Bifidobacterium aquikefiri]|uniref:Cell division protein, FtsK/SpoIIIE n=2 Tax=Bifidobacterium aquikefiri TaxID=1653207 RepID=A0A261G5Z8_9BIFI|nr:cell division protein, FtsK/SpoIIIE [Bifidobacterium aquikefiri]